MATEILNAGALPWEDDTNLSALKAHLKTEPLDPRFERLGFATNVPGRLGFVQFLGNFAMISAVFNIKTDDPELCAELTALIKANTASEKYRDIRHWRDFGLCGSARKAQ